MYVHSLHHHIAPTAPFFQPKYRMTVKKLENGKNQTKRETPTACIKQVVIQYLVINVINVSFLAARLTSALKDLLNMNTNKFHVSIKTINKWPIYMRKSAPSLVIIVKRSPGICYFTRNFLENDL